MTIMRQTFIYLLAVVVVSTNALSYACNNDSVCNEENESCLWCSDCSCSLSGWKARSWTCLPSYVRNNLTASITNTTCNYQMENIIDTDVPLAIKEGSGPVYVQMSTYLKLPKTKQYQLRLESVNVGFLLKVNGHQIINSFIQQPKSKTDVGVILQQDRIHLLEIELFSKLNGPRSLTFKWYDDFKEDFVAVPDLFFNYKICGDHIYDNEVNCTRDKELARTVTLSDINACGDGVCQDRFPDTCFVDCYPSITQQCSPIAPPPNHLGAGMPTRDDTIGALINNQVLWHVPGIEHMAYGFDVIKGTPSLFPIFYFGYCDKDNLRTVQDTYRGNVYTVPEELFVQPSPTCSFSTDSQIYSSSVKLANSMEEKASISVSASGSGSFLGAEISASIAFSGETSVLKARELETKTSGSIIVTEVNCQTSKVQFNKYTFHPAFLADLAAVNSSSSLKKLIQRYGTHFMVNAVLGGRLRQITSISRSFSGSKSKEELSESASLSMSASVSVPAFGSAQASFEGSLDSTTSSEEQNEFEKNSYRSTVITYGGPPGSFGPTTSEAPSNFGDWASAVDLLPVPIDYTLLAISDILPTTWKFNSTITSANGGYIAKEWKQAVDDFFSAATPYFEEMLPYRYRLIYSWNTGLTNLPNGRIKVIFTDTTSVEMTLTDPRIGYPINPASLSNFPNPWLFDFGLAYSLQNISNVQILTSLPEYTEVANSILINHYGGVRQSDVLIHSLTEGLEAGYKNTQFTQSGPDANGVYHRYFDWRRNDDPLNSLQILFEIQFNAGQDINNGTLQITLIGTPATARYTTTQNIFFTRNYTHPQPIKFYLSPTIKSISYITKAIIKFSSWNVVNTNTSSAYTIQNFVASQYMCKDDFSAQPCTTLSTSEKRIFVSPFGRKYKISNADTLPIAINLYRPQQLID